MLIVFTVNVLSNANLPVEKFSMYGLYALFCRFADAVTESCRTEVHKKTYKLKLGL